MYWKLEKATNGWLVYNYLGFHKKPYVAKTYFTIGRGQVFPVEYELVVKAVIVPTEQDFYKFYLKEQPLKIKKLLP